MWTVCLPLFVKLGSKLVSAFPPTSSPCTMLFFPQTQNWKEDRKSGLSLHRVRMWLQHELGPNSWGDQTIYVQRWGLQQHFRARRNTLLCSTWKVPSNSCAVGQKGKHLCAKKPKTKQKKHTLAGIPAKLSPALISICLLSPACMRRILNESVGSVSPRSVLWRELSNIRIPHTPLSSLSYYLLVLSRY